MRTVLYCTLASHFSDVAHEAHEAFSARLPEYCSAWTTDIGIAHADVIYQENNKAHHLEQTLKKANLSELQEHQAHFERPFRATISSVPHPTHQPQDNQAPGTSSTPNTAGTPSTPQTTCTQGKLATAGAPDTQGIQGAAGISSLGTPGMSRGGVSWVEVGWGQAHTAHF